MGDKQQICVTWQRTTRLYNIYDARLQQLQLCVMDTVVLQLQPLNGNICQRDLFSFHHTVPTVSFLLCNFVLSQKIYDSE